MSRQKRSPATIFIDLVISRHVLRTGEESPFIPGQPCVSTPPSPVAKTLRFLEGGRLGLVRTLTFNPPLAKWFEFGIFCARVFWIVEIKGCVCRGDLLHVVLTAYLSKLAEG